MANHTHFGAFGQSRQSMPRFGPVVFLLRLLLTVVIHTSVSHGQQVLSEATLQRLKDATVLVKVEGKNYRATGSGFLVRTDGLIGYIATNHHVIDTPYGVYPKISLILNSGTEKEKSCAGNVVGSNKEKDIAIVKLQCVGLPRPLLKSAEKPRETLPVFIIGFPFGEELSLNTGNPSVTIGRGSVSSFRTADFGRIIQIDGDLNPGNSGGPIVDSTGGVLGIAVAKVGGTQIAFAIPYGELEKLTEGTIQDVSFDPVQSLRGPLKFRVEAVLVDPFQNLKVLSLLMIPTSAVKSAAKQSSNGNWERISEAMKEYPLSLIAGKATGEVIIEDPKLNLYTYQIKQVRRDGRILYTEPSRFHAEGQNTHLSTTKPDNRSTPTEKKQPWLGNPENEDSPATALTTPKSLLSKRHRMLDAFFSEVNLPVSKLLPSLTWSASGSHIYALEKPGIIHRIQVPDFKTENRVDTTLEISQIVTSKQGLVAASPITGSLLLLHSDNLRLKQKIQIPRIATVTTSPRLSQVFVTTTDSNLLIVDLEKNRVAAEIRPSDVVQYQKMSGVDYKKVAIFSGFENTKVTANGNYLFANSNGQVHRFRVKQDDVVYEETSHFRSWGAIDMSEDSAYVSIPVRKGFGNDELQTNFGHVILGVDDLLKQILLLQTDVHTEGLSFDHQASKIYAHGPDAQIHVYDQKGRSFQSYKFSPERSGVRQVLLHPTGGKLLLMTSKRLFWIELP